MKDFSINSCNACTKLNETEKQYNCFISQLSHEIRNPMTLIYSSLQLIELDHPAVIEFDLWNQVKQELQSVIDLLQDASSLNKLCHLNPSVIPVAGFVSQIKESFYPLLKERNIQLLITLDSSVSELTVSADPIKLKEALTNLLLNAVNALYESAAALSAKPQIILSANRIENNLIFHVKDNGPGIPSEYLDTLFEPFITHRPNGTGLGLCIVKKIASLHNGSISVTTCSKGSETFTDFCLSLPL